MPNKVCYVCRNEKNIEMFALANNHKSGDGRAAYCCECSLTLTEREKATIVTRLWRTRNKERHDATHKVYTLQKTDDISLERYEKLLQEQNSVCAVCGEASTGGSKSGKIHSLCVDHDHETGAVRALLCHNCNVLLGYIESNPLRVKLLVKYLEKHKAK